MSDIELIHKYISADKQEEALKKLEQGYPVQYIIGNVEFYNNLINVNENVLIPRFETEYLVQKTINYFNKLKVQNANILEIGTGSGCIAIALKQNINSTVDAIDISDKAIQIAKQNSKLNNTNINFFVKDIHDFDTTKKYDLIISNPPYVPYDGLIDEKIKYEPENAIFAINNGIYYYDVILNKIKNNLKENFLIAFEIGDNEGEAIKNLVYKYFSNVSVKIEKDLNNYERYLFISNNDEILK